MINYKPFQFRAEAGVSIGVATDMDILFIHAHNLVEVSADLKLWGPPFAGAVHIDVKVAKFDINFGSAGDDQPPATLHEFYHLVLQASSSRSSQSGASTEDDDHGDHTN